MKTVYLSVTNDVIADQRVNRIATTLSDLGLQVVVVGVKRKKSVKYNPSKFKVVLLRLPFQKSFLFYAFYNFQLFCYLLFKKHNVLVANDLDSLSANYFASILKKSILIYDSHELFTELPEIEGRPFVKKVWSGIEKYILPKLKNNYTVCDSISGIYKKKYDVAFSVIRNVPFRKELLPPVAKWQGKKIIIYQGALNIGRGIESAILAMKHMNDTILLIAGQGDITEKLKSLVLEESLKNKVEFLGRLTPDKLHQYTCSAHLGFSLEENLSLNYYYALPNKLFDYIQAEVPVLVSDFPEMRAIVGKYDIGEVLIDRSPEKLAQQFSEMLLNEDKRALWKINLKKAAEELCWENEKSILVSVYKNASVLD